MRYKKRRAEEEERLDLGSCCVCGKADATVRNLVTIERRASVPGTGWGCMQCGLPQDGAVAVVCDACLQAEKVELKEVIFGQATDKARVPFDSLPQEPFNHDLSKHPEVRMRQAAERMDRRWTKGKPRR